MLLPGHMAVASSVVVVARHRVACMAVGTVGIAFPMEHRYLEVVVLGQHHGQC